MSIKEIKDIYKKRIKFLKEDNSKMKEKIKKSNDEHYIDYLKRFIKNNLKEIKSLNLRLNNKKLNKSA